MRNNDGVRRAVDQLTFERRVRGQIALQCFQLASNRNHLVAAASDVAHRMRNAVKPLAEIGALASAVAHEVRNPLGILGAHLSILERKDVDPETLAAMREQIDRASGFVDDLLTYGRPRPLELRLIDVVATIELAISTARQGAPFDASDITMNLVDPPPELLAER